MAKNNTLIKVAEEMSETLNTNVLDEMRRGGGPMANKLIANGLCNASSLILAIDIISGFTPEKL